MADIEVRVEKVVGYVFVALDSDGTPLSHGECMVEVEPGVWKSPALIEVEEYLSRMVPLGEGYED